MGHPVGIGLPSVRLWGMHDVDGMCKVELWVGGSRSEGEESW